MVLPIYLGDQVDFESSSDGPDCAARSWRIVSRAVLALFVSVAAVGIAQWATAATVSLAGIDYQRLCRDTRHVPLVQAAIDPAYINVWSMQESERAGRFEQYSFASQRIDVRAEHEISLYHGLIHRTLDLIGESEWKHRDLAPHEDREHWLIYYTLETHWPGAQWRQGREPSPATLLHASQYWRQYAERYTEIAAKAATLAGKSWCARNGETLEVNAPRPPASAPASAQTKPKLARATPSPVEAMPSAPSPQPAPEPTPQVQPTQVPQVAQTSPPSRSTARPQPVLQDALGTEPIWVRSEFLAAPSVQPASTGPSRWESEWASSPTTLPSTP